MAGARLHRLARELELLRNDPPPGVAAWLVDEADISRFHASESQGFVYACSGGIDSIKS
jgi:hypothetical protein